MVFPLTGTEDRIIDTIPGNPLFLLAQIGQCCHFWIGACGCICSLNYDLVSHSLLESAKDGTTYGPVTLPHDTVASRRANPYWLSPQIFRPSVRFPRCRVPCCSVNPQQLHLVKPTFLTPAEFLNTMHYCDYSVLLPVKSLCCPRWCPRVDKFPCRTYTT